MLRIPQMIYLLSLSQSSLYTKRGDDFSDITIKKTGLEV